MASEINLKVEEGECATLSPTSERFNAAYERVRPRSAAEVRSLLGVSEASTKALQHAGACCVTGRRPAVIPAAEDLDAEDAAVRANARQATYEAFNAYVHGGAAAASDHLAPLFDRYLDLSKAVLNIARLQDIEVMNGATLTISANTHAVYARKIIIHQTGRLVCIGAKTFHVQSVEGVRRIVIDGVKNVASAAVLNK